MSMGCDEGGALSPFFKDKAPSSYLMSGYPSVDLFGGPKGVRLSTEIGRFLIAEQIPPCVN